MGKDSRAPCAYFFPAARPKIVGVPNPPRAHAIAAPKKNTNVRSIFLHIWKLDAVDQSRAKSNAEVTGYRNFR